MRTPEIAAAEGGQSQLPVHATVANDAAKIDPALHPPDTQSAAESLPAGELDPAGQLLQAPDPSVALYLPATHAVHGPPLAPVKPLLHEQSLTESLPTGESESDGQLMHVLKEVPPEVVEYLAAGHRVQDAEPAPAREQAGTRKGSRRQGWNRNLKLRSHHSSSFSETFIPQDISGIRGMTGTHAAWRNHLPAEPL